MAKLIYSAITSLDWYVADEDGRFDWGEPDEEVHTFLNDLERLPLGAGLQGSASAAGRGAHSEGRGGRSRSQRAPLRGAEASQRQAADETVGVDCEIVLERHAEVGEGSARRDVDALVGEVTDQVAAAGGGEGSRVAGCEPRSTDRRASG
jgi:hypothetical protein